MTTYTADIEIPISPTPNRAEHLLEQLQQLPDWHPAIGRSADGYLEATVTLEASSLNNALGQIREGLERVVVHAVRVEVLPSDVYDARAAAAAKAAESTGTPTQLSVTQAAERAGVSRPRILQMITEDKVTAERLGRAWMIDQDSLDAEIIRLGRTPNAGGAA